MVSVKAIVEPCPIEECRCYLGGGRAVYSDGVIIELHREFLPRLHCGTPKTVPSESDTVRMTRNEWTEGVKDGLR